MFEYAFMQNAFIVALLISIVCPLIGIFLVLRRYSMIGDALSHASLAGVAVGLLFDWNPVLSAFGLTSFSASSSKSCAAVSVVMPSSSWSLFIALRGHRHYHHQCRPGPYERGILLVRQYPDCIDRRCLFCRRPQRHFPGRHCQTLPSIGHADFDEDGAQIAGVRSKLINYVFAVLVAATISVSIRIVGILVISSLIALPVATALQLRKGFRRTLIYSVVFSFIDILSGLLLSYYIDAAPGGVTALTSVAMLLLVIAYKECVFSLQEKRRRP